MEVNIRNFREDEVKMGEIYIYNVLLAQGLPYMDEEGKEMIEVYIDTITGEQLKDVNCLINKAKKDSNNNQPR
eukprot:6759470-Ditylum_brightwellii.AAC.1